MSVITIDVDYSGIDLGSLIKKIFKPGVDNGTEVIKDGHEVLNKHRINSLGVIDFEQGLLGLNANEVVEFMEHMEVYTQEIMGEDVEKWIEDFEKVSDEEKENMLSRKIVVLRKLLNFGRQNTDRNIEVI